MTACSIRGAAAFVLALLMWCLPGVSAQTFQPTGWEPPTREAAIVDAASQVLHEIMAIPARGIPMSLLADAQGVAIVPDLLKGGFVVGVRRGRGVLVMRDENGQWRPPTFITVTGGSVGWQIGVQATDLVLVFKTKTSVESLMRGQFTIGGGLAAAAGPVGRQVEAGTDARLRAEILSYARSRGLFAGAALDGSVIQVDVPSNAAYYGTVAAGQAPALPPSAVRLLEVVSLYAPGGFDQAGATALPAAVLPAGAGGADARAVQRELSDASRRLAALLDDSWRQYLMLPAEVHAADRLPSADALQEALRKYDRVAASPQYQALVQRPEFQQAHALLKRLCAQQTPAAPLTLPPPPSARE